MKWHCKNFKWNKCWNTKEPKASSPCFIFSAQRCIFKETGSIERGDRSFLKLYTVLHHRFYYSDNSYPRNLPAQVLFHNAEFIKGMEAINLLLCTIWWRTEVTSGQELNSSKNFSKHQFQYKPLRWTFGRARMTIQRSCSRTDGFLPKDFTRF